MASVAISPNPRQLFQELRRLVGSLSSEAQSLQKALDNFQDISQQVDAVLQAVNFHDDEHDRNMDGQTLGDGTVYVLTDKEYYLLRLYAQEMRKIRRRELVKFRRRKSDTATLCLTREQRQSLIQEGNNATHGGRALLDADVSASADPNSLLQMGAGSMVQTTYNHEFPEILDEWANRPFQLALDCIGTAKLAGTELLDLERKELIDLAEEIINSMEGRIPEELPDAEQHCLREMLHHLKTRQRHLQKQASVRFSAQKSHGRSQSPAQNRGGSRGGRGSVRIRGGSGSSAFNNYSHDDSGYQRKHHVAKGETSAEKIAQMEEDWRKLKLAQQNDASPPTTNTSSASRAKSENIGTSLASHKSASADSRTVRLGPQYRAHYKDFPISSKQHHNTESMSSDLDYGYACNIEDPRTIHNSFDSARDSLDSTIDISFVTAATSPATSYPTPASTSPFVIMSAYVTAGDPYAITTPVSARKPPPIRGLLSNNSQRSFSQSSSSGIRRSSSMTSILSSIVKAPVNLARRLSGSGSRSPRRVRYFNTLEKQEEE